MPTPGKAEAELTVNGGDPIKGGTTAASKKIALSGGEKGGRKGREGRIIR